MKKYFYNKRINSSTRRANTTYTDMITKGINHITLLRNICIFFILVILLLGFLLSQAMKRPVYKPYMIVINERGEPIESKELIDSKVNISEYMLQNALENFIFYTRYISADINIIRKNLRQAYFYVSKNGANYIEKIINEEQPEQLAKNISRDITFVNYFVEGEKSRRIDWIEKIYNINGQLIQEIRKSGLIQYAQLTNINDHEILKINPLGIYITNISVGEIK